MAQGADARTERCAPTVREAPLPTAPSSAWGPQEATVGHCLSRLQEPVSRPALAHTRILWLREVKKLTQGHTASKQATDRASPPHSPCEVPSAHRASRSRSRDCGAMRGREQGRARGTQTGAPALREPHKTPFLPTRPAFPAVPGPCRPRGGLCAVTGPAAFSARVPGDSGQSEDKRSRTRFRGPEPRTYSGEGRRGGEGEMEGAVATQDGELEHGRDFSLVKERRAGSNLVARRGWRDDRSFAPGKRALLDEK